jgi:peptidoglycan/LPS O-acetylase OafA/YrhL
MHAPIETRTSSGHLNVEIECLRAFAVAMAVFSHINPLVPGGSSVWAILAQFITGWAGVDLFFCISGYVISKTLVENFDRSKTEGRWAFAMQAFWVRRFFRIAPSAWLWVLVPLVCSIVFNKTGQFWTFDINVRSTIAVILNVADFVGPQNMGPNPVYWSLSLEEQFYLIYPFCLLLTPVAWRWKLLLAAIALQVIPDRSALFLSQWWLVRLDAIMWGCVIYQFSRSSEYRVWEPTFMRSKPVAVAVSALLIAFLMMVPVLLAQQLKVVSIVAVISAALVFMASFQQGYIFPLPKALRAMLLWCGSRSFAIYLIHIPAMTLTHEIWFRINPLSNTDRSYGWRMLSTWIVLLIVLADLNFRFIETPLRRRGAKIAARITSKDAHPAPSAVGPPPPSVHEALAKGLY